MKINALTPYAYSFVLFSHALTGCSGGSGNDDGEDQSWEDLPKPDFVSFLEQNPPQLIGTALTSQPIVIELFKPEPDWNVSSVVLKRAKGLSLGYFYEDINCDDISCLASFDLPDNLKVETYRVATIRYRHKLDKPPYGISGFPQPERGVFAVETDEDTYYDTTILPIEFEIESAGPVDDQPYRVSSANLNFEKRQIIISLENGEDIIHRIEVELKAQYEGSDFDGSSVGFNDFKIKLKDGFFVIDIPKLLESDDRFSKLQIEKLYLIDDANNITVFDADGNSTFY